MPIAFSYNVNDRTDDAGFGFGWSFSYNAHYFLDSQRVWIVHPDGRKDLYVPASGGFAAPPGIFAQLETYAVGKFKLTMKDRMVYYFEDSTHKKLTRIADANGNEVSMSYTNGELSSITNAAGLTLQLSWTNGHLTKVKEVNAGGRKWELAYNNDGYLLQVTNPLGDVESYDYNQDGQLIRITQLDGNAYLFGYIPGDAVSEIVSCDRSHYLTYDVRGKKTYSVEGNESENGVTVYEFDAKGNLIRKRGNCCGYDTGFAYDGDLNVTRFVDANGGVTTSAFDQYGNKVSETDALGHTRYWQYIPGTNKVSQKTGKLGNITSYVYDSTLNQIEIIHPLGLVVRKKYDAKGQLIEFASPGKYRTQYAYDSLGNVIKVTEPHGRITEYFYDVRGNVIQVKDPRGNSQPDSSSSLGSSPYPQL